jgi:hypothetical protein
MAGVTTTLSYTAVAEGVSRSGDREQPRLRPRLAYPREISAATHAYAAGLFDHHFAKLVAIRNDPSLWPDDAEKPSEYATAWASAMLEQLLVMNCRLRAWWHLQRVGLQSVLLMATSTQT